MNCKEKVTSINTGSFNANFHHSHVPCHYFLLLGITEIFHQSLFWLHLYSKFSSLVLVWSLSIQSFWIHHISLIYICQRCPHVYIHNIDQSEVRENRWLRLGSLCAAWKLIPTRFSSCLSAAGLWFCQCCSNYTWNRDLISLDTL